MFLATAAVSILLSGLLAFAAVRKLSHRPEVVQSYVRVGVPEDKLDYLAYILLAGAGGLIAGLVWAPIGLAAAIGVVAYFLLAIASHIRANDEENLPTPIVIELLAAGALGLYLAML
jgi:hypothetical protein